MNLEELETREREQEEELFNLRLRHAMRQLDNPMQLRYMRRDFARLKSVIAEKKK